RFRDALDAFHAIQPSATPQRSHTIVVGIRASYPGHQRIASSGELILQVPRLTYRQALDLYPDLQPLFREILKQLGSNVGRKVIRAILVPLILSRLGPRAAQLSGKNFTSPTAVFREALMALLKESKLDERREGTAH